MGKGRIIAVILIVAMIGIGVYAALAWGPGDQQDPDTMTIKISAMDNLAGSQDATTSAVGIYRLIDGDYVLQETVTCDALQKESGNPYTSFETLYFKLYDATDTSVCTQYVQWTVPQGTPAQVYDGSFQFTAPFIDRGDTAYDILIQYHNNTAIAASATLDVTNESWNSNFAEIDFELRNTNDDAGYVNSYNFINGYDNNHYVVFKASGTGYDRVNILTKSTPVGPLVGSYERGSAFYWVVQLDSDAITRDKLSGGEYNPDGTMQIPLVFDLTGFQSGDSVTFVYEYRYYASWEHFQATGNWGTSAATNPASSESVTIQY